MIRMDKEYVTRAAKHKVRLLCVDRPSAFSVVGMLNAQIMVWTLDGDSPFKTSRDLDLVEDSEPVIPLFYER